MNLKLFKLLISLIFLSFALSGCAQDMSKFKKKKGFKHDTPLIKEDVKALGKIEVEKSAKMGPTPVDGDIKVLEKRKQISSVKEKNYLLIPDEYMLLKQNVSFKFQNLDYKEAMGLMAKIGDVNILVGEEVAGAIYPGAGSSEGLLVILAIIVWIGWHVLTSKSESEELERLARKRHGANDHKSNITDW